MAYVGIAKVQHYVPQALLRNFGVGKKRHVHTFDKATGRSFFTSTKNVAAESRFYDFEFDGVTLTLEPALAKLEDKAKPLLDGVLSADALGVLSAQDRANLSVLFAVQFARTRWFKEMLRDGPALVADWLRSDTKSDEEQRRALDEYIRLPDENEATRSMARFIVNAHNDFAPHFGNKVWALLQTDSADPFLIGDNPLALQNSVDMGPYGNIGLAVHGIEIYLPLSPTRALAMWCPSHYEQYKKAAANLRAMDAPARQHASRLKHQTPEVDEVLAAIEDGTPLRYRPENVANFNSLQIGFAERYVFASVDRFELARKMIASHPHVKKGPRSRVDPLR